MRALWARLVAWDRARMAQVAAEAEASERREAWQAKHY